MAAEGQPAAAARSAHARARILAFHQGLARDHQPGRDRQDFARTPRQMDWEVELAAVIGRPAKNVPDNKALSYVAGYTIANDLSARDRGRRPHIPDTSPVQGRLGDAQELRRLLPARALDRAGERHQGPAEPRPQAVGQRRPQAGFQHQAQMIFNLAEQIAHLSSRLTLHPGDLILTGTPAGVGCRPRRVPQGRRHGQALDREDRRAQQQDGLSAAPVVRRPPSGMPSGDCADQRCCRWLAFKHSAMRFSVTIETAFSARS